MKQIKYPIFLPDFDTMDIEHTRRALYEYHPITDWEKKFIVYRKITGIKIIFMKYMYVKTYHNLYGNAHYEYRTTLFDIIKNETH